jgi:hypothetical protein
VCGVVHQVLEGPKFDDPGCRCPTCREVCQTVSLWEHGAWRDRHLRVHACLCRSHIWQPVWILVWGVSTIALNVSITVHHGTSRRGGQILEEFWLVEDQSCAHVETCVCGTCPWGPLHEVRRSFDASCPTCRDVCQTVLATLFLAWGLERDRHLRVHACLLPVGRTFGSGFWYEASRPLLSTSV